MPKPIHPAPPKLPTWSIERLVGQHHVSTRDRDVVREFWKRCSVNKHPRNVARAVGRCALLAHKRNVRLYREVVNGKFGYPIHEGLR
jgi:hypothetical protein